MRLCERRRKKMRTNESRERIYFTKDVPTLQMHDRETKRWKEIKFAAECTRALCVHILYVRHCVSRSVQLLGSLSPSPYNLLFERTRPFRNSNSHLCGIFSQLFILFFSFTLYTCTQQYILILYKLYILYRLFISTCVVRQLLFLHPSSWLYRL